jgi:hypothetical protein
LYCGLYFQSGAGASAPNTVGSRAVPTDIVAANGVQFSGSYFENVYFIQGSGGAVDITANPQIAAGSFIGQKLLLIGCSATNSVQFDDGNGIKLKNKGSVYLFDDESIEFVWTGTAWVEIG